LSVIPTRAAGTLHEESAATNAGDVQAFYKEQLSNESGNLHFTKVLQIRAPG
jgi:hypothetical protein